MGELGEKISLDLIEQLCGIDEQDQLRPWPRD